VNFTKIAEKLDGYTGSDIKEVCRESVVKISHSMASLLDKGGKDALQGEDGLRLREITTADLEGAIKKLKKSVNDQSREFQKVIKWNDEYGEIKREKKKGAGVASSLFL
jgi:SpoVK/Ycf46/Vps4 family AAA+-type ATPase